MLIDSNCDGWYNEIKRQEDGSQNTLHIKRVRYE